MITRPPRFLSSAMLAAPLFLLACGSTSSGPAASGGASGTGGKTGSGGSGTGGATGTGGSGTGGAIVASGGVTGSGGKTSTGGVMGSGGAASGGANGGGGAAGGTKGGTGGKTGAGGGGGSGSGSCDFAGGPVTAALYPKGLTLTKACSPYKILDVAGITVDGDGVLTIEAGATLQFDVNTAILVGKTGSGKLLANGTAQAPITMTSIAMDVNGEGWYGIQFYPGTVTGSLVSYTTVDYAGGNADAAIYGEPDMPKNSVTLDHVTINHLNTCAQAPVAVSDPTATSFIIKTCTAGGKPCPP